MQSDSAECAFEALRTEMLGFIGRQARDEPSLAGFLGTVARELAAARFPADPGTPVRLPGCRHLEAALDMARRGPMAPLARAFAALEPALRWIRSEHYRAQLGDAYMENYCYTNILGFDALIPHDRVVAAFFVIGPGRHYPRHRHAAEEIYFPFGGDTLWGQDDRPPAPRDAGRPVHNPPWLMHEMITQGTPLFTFCLWVSEEPTRLARLA